MAVEAWRRSIYAYAGRIDLTVYEMLPQETRHPECSVLLVRSALHAAGANGMLKLGKTAFKALEYTKTKMGSGDAYNTFQAVARSNCMCKYNYYGTTKHKVYRRDQVAELTPFLSASFGFFDQTGPAQHEYRCALQVVSKYEAEQVIGYHDDKMELNSEPGNRHDERDHMVVVSVSCGDSMPFCLRPKVTSRTGNPERENWLRLIGIHHTKPGDRQNEVTLKGMEIAQGSQNS